MIITEMLEIVELTKQFVLSEEFWKYHGYILSGLWLGLSGVGVAVKPRSVVAHLLIFAIVDYSTLFLGGGAIYRVLDQVEKYTQPLILLHLSLGISLMLFMIYQHIIGIIAYHKSIPNRSHRSLGKNLVIYGRMVAALGWLCTQEYFLTCLTAILIISLTLWKTSSKSINPAPKTQ